MRQRIILVLDCGATNVRTIAVNEKGELLACASRPNNTQADPHYPEYKIWDIEEIWSKLTETAREVISRIDRKLIAGVTVTSFGVDGAPVSETTEMLYPVISWACQRTAPIMDNIGKYISINDLYEINGINKFSFNTINKLIWFKENKPEILNIAKYFMFISSLLLYKLSGNRVTERTMAGTSMLTNIKRREFSTRILNEIGCHDVKFPPMAEAGEAIGLVTRKASEESNIPADIPVVAAGHDTQFAIFGAGANRNRPVLSSGTWEILMVRTPSTETSDYMLHKGVTTEFDAVPGLYTTGIQWLGSGVLEWIKQLFYTKEIAEMENDELYSLMIEEAEKATSSNINFSVDFLNSNGSVSKLSMSSKREEIYYSALKSLSEKTKESLTILEKAGNFKAESIICVGGGSKNMLWNKLRANALQIPVRLTQRKETTVLGAALFAMVGIGIYSSAEEARNNINYDFRIIEPRI